MEQFIFSQCGCPEPGNGTGNWEGLPGSHLCCEWTAAIREARGWGDWCEIPEPPVPSVTHRGGGDVGVEGTRRPQAGVARKTSFRTHTPKTDMDPTGNFYFWELFCCCRTRTHDVLKKARTNLSVRNHCIDQSNCHRLYQSAQVTPDWKDLPRGNFWSTCGSTGSQWTSL